MAGYEELKQGLESAGLKLSPSKTGFLSSTNECKRFINLHRTEDQPRAHDLLKDLGLDSSGARRRRIGTQQKRLIKGRRRHMKLTHLKLRSRPVRVRVWKTSVHAAVSYGIEAQGMAPQRVKVLQQQLARHGGLQKGGSTDIVFHQHAKLQDPKDTAIERQHRSRSRSLSLSLRHGSPVASRASLTGPSDPLLAGCPSNAGQAVFAELGSDKMPSALKPRVVGLRPLDRLHGTSGTVVGWLVVG